MPTSNNGLDLIHFCGGWNPDSYETPSSGLITLQGGHVDGIKFDFITDDNAKRFEPIQKIPFLFTGRIPQNGMRTETQVVVKEITARFSGIITKIHPQPTKRELKELSAPYSCDCLGTRGHDPKCKFKNGIKRALGAGHGQRLSGLAVLNFDFCDKMEGLVNPNRVYQVEYRLESNMDCVWIGISAERVNDVDIDELRNMIWPSWRRYGVCCPPDTAPTAGMLTTLFRCRSVFEDATPDAYPPSPCLHSLFISKQQYQSQMMKLFTFSFQANRSDRKQMRLVRRLLESNIKDKPQCIECSNSMVIRLSNYFKQIRPTAKVSFRFEAFPVDLVGMSSRHFQLARLIFCKSVIGHQMFLYYLNSESEYLPGTFVVNVYRWERDDWRSLVRTQRANDRDFLLSIVSVIAKLCGDGWRFYYEKSGGEPEGHVVTVLLIHLWFVILVFAAHRLRYDVSHNDHSSQIRSLFSRPNGSRGPYIQIKEDDGLYGWIRSCTMMLFDADHTRNYHRFYKELMPMSKHCRKMYRQNSKCSNVKCNVSVANCKYVCSKCRCGIYCSRRCQKYDWNRGDHRSLCKIVDADA